MSTRNTALARVGHEMFNLNELPLMDTDMEEVERNSPQPGLSSPQADVETSPPADVDLTLRLQTGGQRNNCFFPDLAAWDPPTPIRSQAPTDVHLSSPSGWAGSAMILLPVPGQSPQGDMFSNRAVPPTSQFRTAAGGRGAGYSYPPTSNFRTLAAGGRGAGLYSNPQTANFWTLGAGGRGAGYSNPPTKCTGAGGSGAGYQNPSLGDSMDYSMDVQRRILSIPVPDEMSEGCVKANHRISRKDTGGSAPEETAREPVGVRAGHCDGQVIALSSDSEDSVKLLDKNTGEEPRSDKRTLSRLIEPSTVRINLGQGPEKNASVRTNLGQGPEMNKSDMWQNQIQLPHGSGSHSLTHAQRDPAHHVGTSDQGGRLNMLPAATLENQEPSEVGVSPTDKVQRRKGKAKEERCIPTAPCTRCFSFFGIRLRSLRINEPRPDVARHNHTDGPPVLKNANGVQAKDRIHPRHGPKSKSSVFRGVTFYKRTGRWEAHIWHDSAQVYLGASNTKEEAAKAYDKAALLWTGPKADINYQPEDYKEEIEHLFWLSKNQLIIHLRQESRGPGAQAKYPGVKLIKPDCYQASYKTDGHKRRIAKTLGLFPTVDEAARAIFKEALRRHDAALAALIMDTHHVRNLPFNIAKHGPPPDLSFAMECDKLTTLITKTV